MEKKIGIKSIMTVVAVIAWFAAMYIICEKICEKICGFVLVAGSKLFFRLFGLDWPNAKDPENPEE